MKLSIFTTITNPEFRGDNWADALDCYHDLADEVIIVDGSPIPHGFDGRKKIKVDKSHVWPYEFSWDFIGKQFQRGYEMATGDWVIHADLDFVFHENDFNKIREACSQYNDQPALTFYKYQFILPDRYNLKSRLVLAVNKKKFGERIKFDSGGDLCQPSIDGKYINPDTVPEARIPFYNYEKLLKTKVQIKDDVGRMARAWWRYFHEDRLGAESDDVAYAIWYQMIKGRFEKPQNYIKLSEHPRYVQETLDSLQPDQFGFSGFGLEMNNYAQSSLRS